MPRRTPPEQRPGRISIQPAIFLSHPDAVADLWATASTSPGRFPIPVYVDVTDPHSIPRLHDALLEAIGNGHDIEFTGPNDACQALARALRDVTHGSDDATNAPAGPERGALRLLRGGRG